IGAVGLIGLRIEAARPRRAIATAEVVQADDEEAVGVDGLARADARIPPARLAVVHAVVAGGVVMPREGMADQHGIAARGVQFAIGFVGQLVIGQGTAASEHQWFGEMRDLRAHQANGIGWYFSGHRARLLEKGAAKSKASGDSIHLLNARSAMTGIAEADHLA